MAEVRVAEHAGACYGVERALELAWGAVDSSDDDICTLGPLIHNPRVVSSLDAMGAHVVDRVEDAAGRTLILRTHGVTPDEERRARELCPKVIDATCPFVKRVHVEVERLTRDGYEVVIVGEAGHPEVVATLGHAPSAHIISNALEVPYARLGNRVGVVVQTTQKREILDAVVEAIRAQGVEPIVKDTICTATRERQDETAQLAEAVDAMVVLGGHNSSNTTRLTEICAARCERTFHVESPAELSAEWFEGCDVVGVTAGASTPEDQIAALVAVLEQL